MIDLAHPLAGAEFLVVDTTKLPVHTETKTVSIKVG